MWYAVAYFAISTVVALLCLRVLVRVLVRDGMNVACREGFILFLFTVLLFFWWLVVPLGLAANFILWAVNYENGEKP